MHLLISKPDNIKTEIESINLGFEHGKYEEGVIGLGIGVYIIPILQGVTYCY